MSLVGPLVVSQPQRGTVVPGAVVSVAAAGVPGSKAIKTSVMAAGAGGTAVPLVPAQYANTLAGGPLGGLVNSVVVVSAPAAVGLMSAGSAMVSTASTVVPNPGAKP